MALKTRSQLIAQQASNWPDNSTGLITPSNLRTPVSDLVSSAVCVYPTIASLRAEDWSNVVDQSGINLLGYYASGDGGGGQFYVSKSDTTTAENGGTVIVASDGTRLKRPASGTIYTDQFGAKHDGVTNDSVAINAAVAALNALGGGTLQFGIGTYLLKSASIQIYSNVYYKGAGEGATIIKLSNNGSYYPCGFFNEIAFPSGTQRANACFSDFTIDGNYSVVADGGSDNYQIGIYSYMCSNTTVERVTFKNVWYSGIENYSGSNGLTVKNCTFTNVGDKHTIMAPLGYYYCVGIDACLDGQTISGNIFNSCGVGVNIFGDSQAVERVNIQGNFFYSMKASCVYGRQGARAININFNIAKNIGDSFVDINYNGGAGSAGGTAERIDISGNEVYSFNTNLTANRYAITLTIASDAHVVDNKIFDMSGGSSGGIIFNKNASPALTNARGLALGNTLYGPFTSNYAIIINGCANISAYSNIFDLATTGTAISVQTGSTGTVIGQQSFYNCTTTVSDAGTGTSIFDLTKGTTLTLSGSASTSPLLINSTSANGTEIIMQANSTSYGDLGSVKAVTGSGNATDFIASSRAGDMCLGTSDTVKVRIKNGGTVNILSSILPTSAAGLSSGDLWRNSNVITIVP